MECKNLNYWHSLPKPHRIQDILFLPLTSYVKGCLTHPCQLKIPQAELNVGVRRIRENGPYALPSTQVRGREE